MRMRATTTTRTTVTLTAIETKEKSIIKDKRNTEGGQIVAEDDATKKNMKTKPWTNARGSFDDSTVIETLKTP